MDVIARTPRKPRARFERLFEHPFERAALVTLVFLLLPVPGLAAAEAGPVAHAIERDGEYRVQARLLRGDARVGVLFDLAPGWHIYWRSSGDTGLPPELLWDVPGRVVGELQWPAPEAFEAGGSEPGAASYGYQEQVLLASALEPGDPAGAVAVAVDVLVCEYECVPATFRLERAAGEPVPGLSSEAEAALFETYAARIPDDPRRHGLELSAAWSQSAMRPGDAFTGALAVRSCTNAALPCRTWKPVRDDTFFPDDMESVSLRPGAVRRDAADPTLYWVELRGSAEPDEPIDAHRLTGIVTLEDPDGARRPVEVDVAFPTAEAGAEIMALGRHWSPPVALISGIGLFQALLLALLGGLVLNLMPCVLPVLAIKIFSISEMADAAHEGRGEPMRHGLAYTVGVVGSMLALGTLVVVLRSAGRSVGWGFQFQEPIYVAGISAVLVAFALNLFGTFEIRGGAGPLTGLGQEATGARRSFFEGLLAVALATPCSAPFLGTAVGFAFASPPAVILAIFVAIGIGLAAPFALVAMVPAWARFVPRSGAWMQVVRSGLGFALLATVLWLLWIFGGSAGIDGVIGLVAFLLGLAFSLWCFGLLQQSAHPRMTVAAGAAVLLVSAAGLNAVNAGVAERSEAPTDVSQKAVAPSDWETWSPEAVATHLRDGRPVFVRFTADWCITCKVNERVALADPDVRTAFEDQAISLLVGDWTQRDDAIRSELSRHGRAGVPVYLVYDPAHPDDPTLLPELLTPDLVLESLAGLDAQATRAPL